MRWHRLTAFALAAIVSCSVLAAPLPRDPSSAERKAVEYVAGYLSRGPVAFRDALAKSSPLASLDAESQLREIEVRAGPSTGSTWILRTVTPSLEEKAAVFSIEFPTGVDETLVLSMTQEEGEWRIADLHCSAEPSRFGAAWTHAEPEPDPGPEESGSRLPLFFAAFAALVGISALALRQRALVAVSLILASVFGVVAGLALHLRQTIAAHADSLRIPVLEKSVPSLTGLGELLDLRRTLLTGDDPSIARAMLDIPTSGPLATTAGLWAAQVALQREEAEDARSLLDRLDAPDVPLYRILRARVATVDKRAGDAAFEYERAIDLGPGHDGLWMEAADAERLLGLFDPASHLVDRLVRIGSREASVYYLAAALEQQARPQGEEVPLQLFDIGWRLQPVERQELFKSPVFWGVMQIPDVRTLVRLADVREPVVEALSGRLGAVELPVGAEATVCGKYLEIRVDRSRLLIPGGAEIAPEETMAIDAHAFRERRETEVLEELPVLMDQTRSSGAVTQPQLRRRVMEAIDALGSNNRWEDLVVLTDPFSLEDEHVPLDIFFARAVALDRLGRQKDVEALVVDMLSSAGFRARAGFQDLVQLAELLALSNRNDLAKRTYELAARSGETASFVDDRIRQISMDERLVTYEHYRTDHFAIRYPPESGRRRAQRVGEILESEFKRLSRWIPVKDFQPTTVHILSWEEFRRIYTGSDHILAFYDGKIRFPIANAILGPEVVSIITHELAHAMVAQATRDQAPHWIQEGIAQHVEGSQYQSNAFTSYEEDQLIPVRVVEAVLEGYPDPSLTRLSYLESLAFIRYLEAKKGIAGIHEIIGRMAKGMTAEAAVEDLFGKSFEQVELDCRNWGRFMAPRIWISGLDIQYDVESGRVSKTVGAETKR